MRYQEPVRKICVAEAGTLSFIKKSEENMWQANWQWQPTKIRSKLQTMEEMAPRSKEAKG
jgi:hypothetical protein